VGLALSEADISRYYRAAEEYLARCKGEQPKAAPKNTASKRSTAQQKKAPEINVYPTGRAREQAAAARSATGKSGAAHKGEKGSAQRKNTPRRAASATQSRQGGTKRKKAGKTSSRRQKGNQRISKLFVALAFLVLALGLFLRARTMGIF
jgi:cobalamin biosynthesis Mg chelatase CobN